MSFGYSMSDFILCIQLAHKVLHEYRQAPQDCQAATTDVAGLQLVLSNVRDAVNGSGLSQDKQQDLQMLLSGCSDTLKELLQVLERFKSLATSSHRRWEKMRWDKDRVERIRLRIVSTVGLLTTFKVELLSASQNRIENLLQQLTKQPHSSRISDETLQSVARGSEEAWWQLGADFEASGINPIMVRVHRDFIVTWITCALDEGSSQENMSGTTELPRSSDEGGPSDRSLGCRPADGRLHSSRILRVNSLESSSNVMNASLAFQRYTEMPIKRSPALRRRRKSNEEHSMSSSTDGLLTPTSSEPKPREDAFRRWSMAAFKNQSPHTNDDWLRYKRNSDGFTASDSSSIRAIVPARSDNEKHRRYSFTDPPRTKYRQAGITNLESCLPNDFLQGSETDQLQLYLLGVAVDALASSAYVIYRAPSQKGSTALSNLATRYRCKHRECDKTWRDILQHKTHQQQHRKLFVCQELDCQGKDGFSSNVDLVRHLQYAHGHTRNGDLRGFACAAELCPRKDKVWLKEENYRLHCSCLHQQEDCDDLVEMSRIFLLQPLKR